MTLSPGTRPGRYEIRAHIDTGGHGRNDLSKTSETNEGKPEMLAALGHAYALGGKQSDAKAMIDKLTKLAASQTYVSSYGVSLIYVALVIRGRCARRSREVHPIEPSIRAGFTSPMPRFRPTDL